MGECKLDHSMEDVRHKLEEQSSYMPDELVKEFQAFLQPGLDQLTLNEAFHLLKKYDLASQEEQEERNELMKKMLEL